MTPRHKLAVQGTVSVLVVMLAATVAFNVFQHFQVEREATESLNEWMEGDSSDVRVANRSVGFIHLRNGKIVTQYPLVPESHEVEEEGDEYWTSDAYVPNELELEVAEWAAAHTDQVGQNVRVPLADGVVYAQMEYMDLSVFYDYEDLAVDEFILVAYVDITLTAHMVDAVNVTFALIALVGGALAALTGYYMGTKIEETEAAQKRFFENMSHELKTPVAAIRGYAEGILADIVEPKHAATSIVREAKRLRSIVDEIMSLSRLEAGAVKLDTEEIVVADFVEDCLMPFEHIAATQRLKVTLDLGPGNVQADEDLFTHALENVLSNAFRHASTFVTVTYRDQVLTVTNDGTMPSAEDVAHLFDRFHSSSTAEGGTGIGLALTKEIVELHGWQIGARIADGTTLEVWMDLR